MAANDGALAEFSALKQEIASRSAVQHNLFALQLTSAGTLFGFALSASSRTLLLLIVPVSSYLLCTRSIVQITSIAVIGEYIRDELEPKIEGLGWEVYWRRLPYPFPFKRWTHPNLLLFAGASALALIWTATPILARPLSPSTVGLAMMWIMDVALTVYLAYLTWISATQGLGPFPRPSH
jgi:hypothetical protein